MAFFDMSKESGTFGGYERVLASRTVKSSLVAYQRTDEVLASPEVLTVSRCIPENRQRNSSPKIFVFRDDKVWHQGLNEHF